MTYARQSHCYHYLMIVNVHASDSMLSSIHISHLTHAWSSWISWADSRVVGIFTSYLLVAFVIRSGSVKAVWGTSMPKVDHKHGICPHP